MPEIRPPPPIGTMTASTSGVCPRSSRPSGPRAARRRAVPPAAPPGPRAAAADRHDARLDVRRLLEDLEPDRPLTRDHLRVVEGVDEGEPLLALQTAGLLVGVGDRLAGGDHPA